MAKSAKPWDAVVLAVASGHVSSTMQAEDVGGRHFTDQARPQPAQTAAETLQLQQLVHARTKGAPPVNKDTNRGADQDSFFSLTAWASEAAAALGSFHSSRPPPPSEQAVSSSAGPHTRDLFYQQHSAPCQAGREGGLSVIISQADLDEVLYLHRSKEMWQRVECARALFARTNAEARASLLATGASPELNDPARLDAKARPDSPDTVSDGPGEQCYPSHSPSAEDASSSVWPNPGHGSMLHRLRSCTSRGERSESFSHPITIHPLSPPVTPPSARRPPSDDAKANTADGDDVGGLSLPDMSPRTPKSISRRGKGKSKKKVKRRTKTRKAKDGAKSREPAETGTGRDDESEGGMRESDGNNSVSDAAPASPSPEPTATRNPSPELLMKDQLPAHDMRSPSSAVMTPTDFKVISRRGKGRSKKKAKARKDEDWANDKDGRSTERSASRAEDGERRIGESGGNDTIFDAAPATPSPKPMVTRNPPLKITTDAQRTPPAVMASMGEKRLSYAQAASPVKSKPSSIPPPDSLSSSPGRAHVRSRSYAQAASQPLNQSQSQTTAMHQPESPTAKPKADVNVAPNIQRKAMPRVLLHHPTFAPSPRVRSRTMSEEVARMWMFSDFGSQEEERASSQRRLRLLESVGLETLSWGQVEAAQNVQEEDMIRVRFLNSLALDCLPHLEPTVSPSKPMCADAPQSHSHHELTSPPASAKAPPSTPATWQTPLIFFDDSSSPYAHSDPSLTSSAGRIRSPTRFTKGYGDWRTLTTPSPQWTRRFNWMGREEIANIERFLSQPSGSPFGLANEPEEPMQSISFGTVRVPTSGFSPGRTFQQNLPGAELTPAEAAYAAVAFPTSPWTGQEQLMWGPQGYPPRRRRRGARTASDGPQHPRGGGRVRGPGRGRGGLQRRDRARYQTTPHNRPPTDHRQGGRRGEATPEPGVYYYYY